MNMNRAKLCAIAFLTTTLSLIPNLAEAKTKTVPLPISKGYTGDACIVLGALREGTNVRVDWGAFRGTRYVSADPENRGPNAIYGVNVYAKGASKLGALIGRGNIETLIVEVSDRVDAAFPRLVEKNCEDTDYRIPNAPYLDWSRRE